MTDTTQVRPRAAVTSAAFRTVTWTGITALVISLVVIAFRLGIIVFTDTEYLVNWVPDDSFYYFETVRNFTLGDGWTFDNINTTNGFHPLWALMLVPVYWVFGSDLDLAFRAAMIYQVALFGAALWVFWRLARRVFGPVPALAGVAIFLWPRFVNVLLGGLEAVLVVLLIMLLVQRWVARAEDTERPLFGWELGVLAALGLMARTDTVFFIGMVVAAAFLFSWWRSRSLGDAIGATYRLWLPGLIAGGVYVTINQVTFGHAMPISGALKNTFPTPSLRLSNLSYMPEAFASTLVWLPVALVVVLNTRVRVLFQQLSPAKQRYLVAYLLLSIGGTVHLLWTVLFMDWAIFNWHFVLQMTATLLLVPVVVDAWATRFSPVLPMVAIIGAVAVLSVFTYRARYNLGERGWHHVSYVTARYVADNTDPDAVFGMKDAGVFGYFSDRSTINLDGVINNYEYQEYLRNGRLAEFLNERDVTCFAQHAFPETTYPAVYDGTYTTQSFPIISRLYDGAGGTIALDSDHEIYRSAWYNYQEGSSVRARMVVWCWPEPIGSQAE